MNQVIDITAEDHRIILGLLDRHLPGTTAWVYGSRAKWTAKKTSDLDLVVFSSRDQQRRVSDLREAVEESNLTIRIDLFEWNEIPEPFKKQIEAEHVVLVDGCHIPKIGKWPSATVQEISEKVAMGPFGSSIRVKTFVPTGVPIISGRHLHGFRIDDTAGYNYISEDHADRLANANVRRGDIVFTHAGNIGQVARVPEDSKFDRYVISQRQFYLRCDTSKVLPEFVTAYFRSPQGQHALLANASQVGVPSIARPVTYLRTVRIPIPSRAEQRAIGGILDTLDEKIELNRQMNNTLEAMSQALFKSWFIDFDPVWAKMEGRDTGLPDDIADLFPDQITESKLGEMPTGWKLSPLDSIASFQNGLALQKYRPAQGEARLPVVKIAQLRTGKADSGEWAGATIRPECILENGDVVFSWSGSLLVRVWCGGRAALNQHLFKVTSTKYPKWFYLHSVLRHLSEFRQIAQGKATTMGHIKRIHLKEALCAVAPDSVMMSLSEIFAGLLQRQISNRIESRILAAMRDALLPRLISGETRVDGSGVKAPF